MKSEDIYRTILVRMWGDEKFNRLSPLPPSGAGLWIYLLTGPHSNQIGFFRAGEMMLAEELGWELKAFRKAFRECFDEGLIKTSPDYSKDRLIFIPNFLKINFPQNPNVVKSWDHVWRLIPECQLKLEVWHHIKTIMESKDKESKAWSKAFIETCRKPSLKPLRKPFGNPLGNLSPNQEQEQEQEQEEEIPLIPPPSTQTSKTEKAKAKNKTSSEEEFILPDDIPEASWNVWMEHRKKKRATNSTYAKTLLVRKLREISSKTTIPIPSLIDTAILRNWTGIEEDWITKGGSHVASIQGNGSRPKTFREIDAENEARNRRNYLIASGLLPPDVPLVDAGLPSLPDPRQENAGGS